MKTRTTVSANGTDSANASCTYVLITPARNEERFLEQTIKSVVEQTVRPLKWVIVSDGSTDGTASIAKRYAAEHEWIELVCMPDRPKRHFAGKVHAFNAGYAKVKGLNYDFIGSLDADVSFDSDYFAFLLGRLSENPGLGLAGAALEEEGKSYDYRFVSIEHVSGACQLFRRECFEEIGGYVPMPEGGVDYRAVITARMKGWQTRTFPQKTGHHHRKTGSASIKGFRERIHRGRMDYLLGSHPVWEIFRCSYQMKNRPYVVGGGLIMFGFVWTMLQGSHKTIPEDLIRLRRREQMQQLKRIILQVLNAGKALTARG